MTSENIDSALERVLIVARMADSQKAEDVHLLGMSEVCSFTDYFLVATCLSSVQLRGLGHRIERHLRDLGVRPLNTAGFESDCWVILDYGDFIVHLFTAEGRDYYRLENLWAQAERVDWEACAEARGIVAPVDTRSEPPDA